MTVTVYINDEIVDVKTGIPITENLEETFDSGVLVIPFTTREEVYKPYSEVRIVVSDVETPKTYYFYVSSDNVQITSKQPLIYEHTITLIETTERLTKVGCRNLMFTQPLDGKVKYYMQNVINRIMEVTPLEMQSKLGGTRQFSVSTELFNKIYMIPAPQFSVGDSTLFETLKYALSPLNIIPRLKDFEILSFDDYNALKNEITFADVHNRSFERISTYDVKNLISNVSNVVSEVSTHKKVYPGYGSYAMFKNLSSVFQNIDDNMVAYVDEPIEKILKFELRFSFKYTYGQPEVEIIVPEQTHDFTKYVLEKDEWDLLNVNGENSQSSRFYYQKRTNYIGNIFNITGWDLFNQTTLQNAFAEWLKYDYFDYDPSYRYSLVTNLRDIVYTVEYVPFTNVKLRMEKWDIDNELKISETYINQSQATSSFEKFTKNLLGVVNRIGNDELKVEKICKFDDRYLPQQFYKNEDGYIYIVTQTETVLYNDYVISRATLTKNFNRLAQFINVNQEQRFYNLDYTKAQKSYDTYSEYVLFGYDFKTGTEYNDSILNTIARNTIVATFFGDIITNNPFREGDEVNINPIEQVVYQYSVSGSPKYVAMPVTKYAGSNTLNFVFGFEHPKVAGYKTIINGSRVVRKGVDYTYEDGTITQFSLMFAGTTKVHEITESVLMERARNYPEIPSGLLSNYFDYTHGTITNLRYNKDSSEIFGLNYQLHFIHDPALDKFLTYVIGDAFFETNRILTVDLCYEDRYTDLIYVSTTETYSKFETNIYKGTVLEGAKISLRPSSIAGAYRLRIVDELGSLINMQPYKSWAIVRNGKLLLACNNNNYNFSGVDIQFMNKRKV